MQSALPFPIIAIDGPAGAGKSTLAKGLAKRLGFSLLNTGAIYRALAYCCLQKKISTDDILGIVKEASILSIRFESKNNKELIFINDKEISAELNSPKVSQTASFIAGYKEIRLALLPLQKRLAIQAPCVVEGRDVGTTLFPNAPIKFFVTASPEIRAQRRFLELQKQIPSLKYQDILEQQQERDLADQKRTYAPLRIAEDAVLIDSSTSSIEELLEQMEFLCRKKLL